MNSWSNGAVKKITVNDFHFNIKDVQWKGKSIKVEYDFFVILIQSWVKMGMSKEEALDLLFEMQ